LSSRLTFPHPPPMRADVVRSRGAKRMRRELLVGFDPVAHYAALLEASFGHLAAFFWDGCGGRAVGVKWRPDALRPTALSPATAHAAKPAAAAEGAGVNAGAKGKADKRQQRLVVVPDPAAALAQMYHMGAGLVQDVLLCGGPRS